MASLMQTEAELAHLHEVYYASEEDRDVRLTRRTPADDAAQPFEPVRSGGGGWRWVYLAPAFGVDAAVTYLQCVTEELRRMRRNGGDPAPEVT